MEQELLKNNFERHGFKTSFFDTKEAALDYLKDQISGKKVAIGGSVTAQEMGLYEALSEKNEVIWHWKKVGRETLVEARSAEVYITSANGVSKTGELVNIDGITLNIVDTAGIHDTEDIVEKIGVTKAKVCPDLTSAMERAKQIAAPKNAARLQVQTPCAKTGVCVDCNSPARICHSIVILERPSNGMEVEVVFVDEEMGY